MKEQFVSGLVDGASVDSVFVLRVKEMRVARTGEAYLHMELADRTGRIGAVKFRPDPEADSCPTGSVVHVRGRVTSFRGTRRVSVERMRPCEMFDRHDLLPGPRRDAEEAGRAFRREVRRVRDVELQRLLHRVFSEPRFFARFLECPAAQSHHHAYLGGLAEHTVAVSRICLSIAGLYDQVDRDLLITAALLHDIGKVDELTFDTTIDYTDEGRLLGHVILGERRVREAAEACGLSPQRSALLSHILLSHHGELEWGSPKRPSTLEALLLHHADNMDAKAAGFVQLAENAQAAEERWTDAANLFRRPLYAPAAAESERWVQPSDDDAYVVRSA